MLAYDFADPESGEQKAVFDLAWPNGIQEELSQPVAVLLNETADTLSIASQAGFRCFTETDDFKRYVQREILSLEVVLMSTVGQIERMTQARVVKLFRDTLGYDYLGDWEEREGNACIETDLLSAWLKKQGVRRGADHAGAAPALESGGRHRARASTTATGRSTTCCATA